MRNHSIKPLIIGASLLGVAAIRLNAATAGFDVLVLDADSGAPISGVDVTGWFSNNNGWKAWTDSAPTYDDKKTTDAKGLCHVEGETNTGEGSIQQGCVSEDGGGYPRVLGEGRHVRQVAEAQRREGTLQVL